MRIENMHLKITIKNIAYRPHNFNSYYLDVKNK